MKATIQHNDISYSVDLDCPMDISIPINSKGPSAWGISPLKISPVEEGEWIGDVERGSGVNFNNIIFNPHAHATHTECVGHISHKKESLNTELIIKHRILVIFNLYFIIFRFNRIHRRSRFLFKRKQHFEFPGFRGRKDHS